MARVLMPRGAPALRGDACFIGIIHAVGLVSPALHAALELLIVRLDYTLS